MKIVSQNIQSVKASIYCITLFIGFPPKFIPFFTFSLLSVLEMLYLFFPSILISILSLILEPEAS